MARLWGCLPDDVRQQTLADYGEMVRLLDLELAARKAAAKRQPTRRRR